MASPPCPGYRADIDGLRGVAVLAVVLFHLSPTSLPGGYVGVDIFFVISGYLITGQIRAASAEGRFSFTDFYARRVRRLYPALIVTLLLTWAGAYFTLLPGEMLRVSHSMLATLFYVPNIYFYFSTDYFSENTIHPLLHTWSLGVEEQFYLVFPAILVVLARLPVRYMAMGIVVLALASLLLAEHLTRQDSAAAFYGTIPRFWEFAAGAILTFQRTGPVRGSLNFGMALAGLLAICAATWLMSETSPVPGIVTLAPVLGACALIAAGSGANAVSHVLAVQPLRFLGTVSYSLYLIHWPLIVMTKAVYRLSFPRWVELILLATSIALAYLLTRYVERPSRRMRLPAHRMRIYALGAASTAAVACIGAMTVTTDGFADRFPYPVRQVAAYLDYDAAPVFRAGTCLINAKAARQDDTFDEARCVGRPGAGQRPLLLLGDSYAAQYFAPLSRTFPHLPIAQVTATGCRPLLATEGADRCASLMRHAYLELIPRHEFSVIVLAGRWHVDDVSQLRNTADYLRGRAGKVYVFGPMVEYEQALPRLLALEVLDHSPRDLVAESRRLREAQALDSQLEAAIGALGSNVRYISVLDQLCSLDDCRTLTPSGAPAQFDYGHLTVAGGALILRRLRQEGRLKTIYALAERETRSRAMRMQRKL